MNFLDDSKSKLYDSVHSLRERTLFIIDFFCIVVILIVYALFQHVLPSIDIKNNTTNAEPVLIIEGPMNVVEKKEIPDSLSESVAVSSNASDSKFADKFSESVISTANVYKSPTVSVEIIEDFSEESSNQHWFIADIYIKDVRSLQTYVLGASTGGKLSTRAITEISEELESIVTINGDFAVLNNTGFAVRNGKTLNAKQSTSDICVMFKDGSIECYSAEGFDSEEILKSDPWQIWAFGPSLLDNNGSAKTDFPSRYGNLLGRNPRTILGYYEPGHYCFVTIDGRQHDYASGMTLEEAALLMEDLGCKVAFNLDGGKSTQMVFGTEIVNRPSGGGRFLSDVLFIKDYSQEEEN